MVRRKKKGMLTLGVRGDVVESITITPVSSVIPTFNERRDLIANVGEVEKLGWLVTVAFIVS